jgi:hypothetical protein
LRSSHSSFLQQVPVKIQGTLQFSISKVKFSYSLPPLSLGGEA